MVQEEKKGLSKKEQKKLLTRILAILMCLALLGSTIAGVLAPAFALSWENPIKKAVESGEAQVRVPSEEGLGWSYLKWKVRGLE